jgi:ABC-type ATPase with predicted acetyltransferase domain
VVAVAVLSWPTVNSAVREEVLGLGGWAPGRRLAFVNERVRTISRVIVHPQFRGVGVASGLVRRVCEECPTRWVEAFAVMGRVNPFFVKAGMREFRSVGDGRPVYYLNEKERGGGERGAGELHLRCDR